MYILGGRAWEYGYEFIKEYAKKHKWPKKWFVVFTIYGKYQ